MWIVTVTHPRQPMYHVELMTVGWHLASKPFINRRRVVSTSRHCLNESQTWILKCGFASHLHIRRIFRFRCDLINPLPLIYLLLYLLTCLFICLFIYSFISFSFKVNDLRVIWTLKYELLWWNSLPLKWVSIWALKYVICRFSFIKVSGGTEGCFGGFWGTLISNTCCGRNDWCPDPIFLHYNIIFDIYPLKIYRKAMHVGKVAAAVFPLRKKEERCFEQEFLHTAIQQCHLATLHADYWIVTPNFSIPTKKNLITAWHPWTGALDNTFAGILKDYSFSFL